MNALTIIILIFSVLGAIDLLIGNKFGLGKEFERGFKLFCPMVLSMAGMIVLAPAIGVWISPLLDGFYNLFKIDPSIIPSAILANDMGGMQLAQSVAKNTEIGNYNAFIVSSMMGCVISFTIPFSLGIVKKNQRNELFYGILCGIATIPIGCLIGGLILGISFFAVLLNLLPLIIIGAIIILALVFFKDASIKCFTAFGVFIRFLSYIGLILSIFTFLTKIEIAPYFDTFENASYICANACVTLSGALPMMYVIGKLLNKPLNKLGLKIGINGDSAVAFLGTLVTNASTFGVMEKMDKKGTVLNSAFAVSASFTIGGHLAFTMVFDSAYVLPMIIAKIISGICAVTLAMLIYKNNKTPIA